MTWSPRNFRVLYPGVPALLLMGQEWCVVHPLYRLSVFSLLPRVASAQLLLMAPITLPQTWLPLNFWFLNTAVLALLLVGQGWCLAHPWHTLSSLPILRILRLWGLPSLGPL